MAQFVAEEGAGWLPHSWPLRARLGPRTCGQTAAVGVPGGLGHTPTPTRPPPSKTPPQWPTGAAGSLVPGPEPRGLSIAIREMGLTRPGQDAARGTEGTAPPPGGGGVTHPAPSLSGSFCPQCPQRKRASQRRPGTGASAYLGQPGAAPPPEASTPHPGCEPPTLAGGGSQIEKPFMFFSPPRSAPSLHPPLGVWGCGQFRWPSSGHFR